MYSRDILLLETGFLTVLVAPLNLLMRHSVGFSQHDRVSFWLLKWLLFRLMFASGVVKLTSMCPTWWGLTGAYDPFSNPFYTLKIYPFHKCRVLHVFLKVIWISTS